MPPLPPVDYAGGRGRGGRGWLALPIVAALVFLVGLGLMIGGLAAQSSADDASTDAAQDLADATVERDVAQAALDSALDAQRIAAAELAEVTAEAERVMGVGGRAAGIADRLCDCDGRMVNATRESLAALEARDFERYQRAIDEFNAAVDDANAAVEEFNAAVEELLGLPPGSTDGLRTA